MIIIMEFILRYGKENGVWNRDDDCRKKKNESGMQDQMPLSRSCNNHAFLSVLKFGIHGNK